MSSISSITAPGLCTGSPSSACSDHAYVRAIAPLATDGRHVLFGGAVNGKNEDPRVELGIVLAANDVLLVSSDVDAQGRRKSAVYRPRRP